MRAKCLLTGIILLMVFMLSLDPVAAAEEEIENLAQGGDFENAADMALWRLNLANAQATMTVDKKEAAIGEASLFIDNIILDPAASWKPQIDHGRIPIVEDGVYTISAFLKAEEPREVGIYTEILADPWTKSPNQVLNVGTEWKEYWATGMPPGPEVRLGFSNRGSTVSYWIDGVRFYPGEYVPTEVEGIKIAVRPRSKLVDCLINSLTY